MKLCLLLALAGLAIGLAAPTFAQDKNTVDPEVRQQIEAVLKEREEAINKSDAAAVAALYSVDAVSIRPWESEGGLASGQQAIEKRYADELAASPVGFVDKLAQVCPFGCPRRCWTREGGHAGGLALARLEGDCLDWHSARISTKFAAKRLCYGFNNPIRLHAATCPDQVDYWVAIDQPAREGSNVRDLPLDAEHSNLDVSKPRIRQRFLDS